MKPLFDQNHSRPLPLSPLHHPIRYQLRQFRLGHAAEAAQDFPVVFAQ